MTEKSGREPVLTENARRIFDLRYSLKDAEGNPTETPRQAVKRVAKNIALAGGDNWQKQAKRYEEELLTPLKFVPNSPTWTGAGTDLGQLAACFVLPISDELADVAAQVKFMWALAQGHRTTDDLRKAINTSVVGEIAA